MRDPRMKENAFNLFVFRVVRLGLVIANEHGIYKLRLRNGVWDSDKTLSLLLVTRN
jgi:hypothetical protein